MMHRKLGAGKRLGKIKVNADKMKECVRSVLFGVENKQREGSEIDTTSDRQSGRVMTALSLF